MIFSHRLTDALHYFLILWFYCTLTIRESILVANGSRIRGWWVSHHYISAFLTGIHILWPADAHEYMRFRTKFVVLSLMISIVQVNLSLLTNTGGIPSFRLYNLLTNLVCSTVCAVSEKLTFSTLQSTEFLAGPSLQEMLLLCMSSLRSS